ncbi:MAG: type II toxin-antitoxin system HicB family antitoxin [Acidobacteriia bacterium]|nr:type II toxin-antitoxin system HicB family antitoxin [Terriglobia bacterium]
MSSLAYPAVFSRGKGRRWLVTFVDLPRVSTDGKTESEAFFEAIDALGSDLSIRISQKEGIPAPSRLRKGQRKVPVPLWIAPKVALYLTMRQLRVDNSELTRRLRCRETAVRRLLNPTHKTRAENLQRALAALGRQMVVKTEAVAS